MYKNIGNFSRLLDKVVACLEVLKNIEVIPILCRKMEIASNEEVFLDELSLFCNGNNCANAMLWMRTCLPLRTLRDFAAYRLEMKIAPKSFYFGITKLISFAIIIEDNQLLL